jgi:hypothetical protein
MSATPSLAAPLETRAHGVRPFEPRDLPAVLRLHRRTFASRRMSTPELERYLTEVFCGHPWRDDACPSLVFESRPGDVTGCLGVMPRPMTFRGRAITVAVSHHFMVEPDERSTMAAMHLLRRFLEGPQQLSMAEGNERSRRMWEALHATTVASYSLHWIRPLRPVAYLASAAGRRAGLRVLRPLLQPLSRAGDLVASRVAGPAPQAPTSGTLEPLTPMLLASVIEKMRGTHALRPRYDAASIAWLFSVLASKRSSGDLQAMLVRGERGDATGWFVYYLRRDTAGEVLQIGGHDRALPEVFAHLLSHASRHGAVALTGRLEPRLLPGCAASGCWMRAGKSWMLLHGAHRDMIDAFQSGDAFLSPLEGEWWMSA